MASRLLTRQSGVLATGGLALRICRRCQSSAETGQNDDSLPRPLRHPSTGRFMNPWLKNGQDPCEKTPKESTGSHAQVVSKVRSNDRFCLYQGQRILFDPVFSPRVSPVSFVGPHRFKPPPVSPDFSDWPAEMAKLRLKMWSSQDHLDEATVLSLHKRFPGIRWCVPLGLGSWLRQRGIEATEMDRPAVAVGMGNSGSTFDWWQEMPLAAQDLALVALPVQHWANRFPWDRNTTLWCGYGVVRKVQAGAKDGRKQSRAASS
eukprot:s4319_g4.t1